MPTDNFTSTDLDRIITDAINGVGDNETIDASFVTNAIIMSIFHACGMHDGPVEYCLHSFVRKQVGRVCTRIQKKFSEEAESKQLEAFEDLQPRYMIEEDGNQIFVPRHLIETRYRRAIANRLRGEADKKALHADLLDRETDILIQEGKLEPDEIAA